MSIENVKNCMGCGMCAVVCKNNSISFEVNSLGFYYAKVLNSCTGCGFCEKICPAINTSNNNYVLGAYSAVSKNCLVLDTTSSGGIAYELAKNYFDKGNLVCGVAMSKDNLRAEHIVCKSNEDLDRIKGSKYIASYTVDAFKNLLKNDEKSIVFGTPC